MKKKEKKYLPAVRGISLGVFFKVNCILTVYGQLNVIYPSGTGLTYLFAYTSEVAF